MGGSQKGDPRGSMQCDALHLAKHLRVHPTPNPSPSRGGEFGRRSWSPAERPTPGKWSVDVPVPVRPPLGHPRQADPARVADRQRRGGSHARSAPRAARGRRGARRGALLHRQGEGQSRRPGRGQVDQAGPDGGQDRARRARRRAGLGRRADRPRRPAADPHHAGRPARLRQDHDLRQDRLPPHHPRQEEGADGLARYAAAGGAGAAQGAGRAGQGRHAPHYRRPDAAADRQARDGGGKALGLRRRAARHGRAHPHRRRADAGSGRHPRHRPSARDLAGRRQPDRPGRGEARQELRRARRHQRHRADPRRRRRARRRGAVHARSDRQAHQADRHRREVGRARGLPSPSASPGASSAWATS